MQRPTHAVTATTCTHVRKNENLCTDTGAHYTRGLCTGVLDAGGSTPPRITIVAGKPHVLPETARQLRCASQHALITPMFTPHVLFNTTTPCKEHFSKLKFNFIELETKHEFMEQLRTFDVDQFAFEAQGTYRIRLCCLHQLAHSVLNVAMIAASRKTPSRPRLSHRTSRACKPHCLS